MNLTAVSYALIAAFLFGISTPVAKVLVGSTHPVVLGGLLYCGAGIGIALLRKLPGRIFGSSNPPEAALSRADLPWLVQSSQLLPRLVSPRTTEAPVIWVTE